MRLFWKKKKEEVMCKCKQMVLKDLYSKKYKAHRIGFVMNRTGRKLDVYCNGEEV